MCQSKVQGGRRCLTHISQSAATSLIPRRGKLHDYYQATDSKHFDPANPGSTFTDPEMGSLNDVVALAYRQRGDLHGDDRDTMIKMGCSDETFKPGIRYLMVETTGNVGVKNSVGLPDDTPVRVVRTKPGAPCSLVLDTDTTPTTTYGTIIIGKHPDDETREVVYTAHPGLPTPSDSLDRAAVYENKTIPLSTVRNLYGQEVWLNTVTCHK